MFRNLMMAGAMAGAALVLAGAAQARELKAVGITDAAHQANPAAKVTIAPSDYDLNKQFTQIDHFISAGVERDLRRVGPTSAGMRQSGGCSAMNARRPEMIRCITWQPVPMRYTLEAHRHGTLSPCQ